MWLKNLFQSLTASPSRPRPARRRSARPCLEALEDRWVPSFGQPVNVGADHPSIPGFGWYPQAVVAADFNGDGRLDLATALREENTLSVVLGNGDGTFQVPRTFSCVYPQSIQAGDLNADGKADLVISNGDTIRVLLANGNGTFQAAQAITLEPQISPSNPELGPLPQHLDAVALSDFNGDGTLDLVAAGSTLHSTFIGYDENGSPYYEDHVDCYGTVLLGNGDGTFPLAAANPMPPISGDAGDFNNDGRLDLLTASGVLPGNGDGTFGTFVPYAYSIDLGGASHPVGDFNGDGKLDVLAGTPYGPILTIGNGDGTFRQGQWLEEFDGGLAFVATAAGDVNGDGKLDIVVIPGAYDYDEWTSSRSMHVLLGHGDGSFAPVVSDLGTFSGIGYLTSAVLADFDGDGLPDLATSDVYAANNATPSVYRGPFVARNDGGWTVPPPAPPSVTVSDATVSEGNTGTRAATFTVTLSAASSQPVTVAYAAVNGTAAAGSDYQAASGTLTIPAGQTTGTITVLVNGDRLGETNEAFSVNLSSPTNATITDGQGVGIIIDDEPHVSISDVTVAEGNSGTRAATFTVTLSAAYDANVTVTYATANGTSAGSDFTATSGTLTFTPGQTAKTISVVVKGDRLGETNETFFVNLGGATNATIADAQGVGTIVDDEPRISIGDTAKQEGKKGHTTLFTFTVTLSAAYDQPVTMSFATGNGTARTNDSDYVARAGTLTFAPGETTKTITIEVKGDSKKEADEYFYLDLFNNSSNSLFTKSRGLGTILNDD
jgi:hypothetical protein